MSTEEAKLKETPEGAVVSSPGWYVLNLADGRWDRHEIAGEWTAWESRDAPFEQYAIGVHVLRPGQPNGRYHSESVQEDFLVLSGECLLLVEDEERQLKAWDFFHCAPGTDHILVGAGERPCAILMVGVRSEGKKLHYPRNEKAARYDASAPEETVEPREAYRDWTEPPVPVRATWPL